MPIDNFDDYVNWLSGQAATADKWAKKNAEWPDSFDSGHYQAQRQAFTDAKLRFLATFKREAATETHQPVDCRKEFEKYFGKPFWLGREGSGYKAERVQKKWDMWETAWVGGSQAALKATETEREYRRVSEVELKAVALYGALWHILNEVPLPQLLLNNGREAIKSYTGLPVEIGIVKVPERGMNALTTSDKYEIADCITTESRSKTDVVQDVFDELAERFDIWRRG